MTEIILIVELKGTTRDPERASQTAKYSERSKHLNYHNYHVQPLPRLPLT